MPRYHPVSLQIADYLEYIASDLRARKPSPRVLASDLDGLLDKMSFYANVCHSLTDQPVPARDNPAPPPVSSQASRDETTPDTVRWVKGVTGQTRSDIEMVARAIRVAELSQPVMTSFSRLVEQLQSHPR